MDRHGPPGVTNSRLAKIGFFAMAMGLAEAIVVVYLRELYFPDGFRFPLRYIPVRMLQTEMLRELATLVMLAMVALVAARKSSLRLAVFLFAFGIWDIFYYVFLKVLLDWPQSFFTWDVLFLIPVAWIGPVLAPVLCSITMIGLAILLIMLDRRYERVCMDKAWSLMAAGAGFIFFSFIRDYGAILITGGFYKNVTGLATDRTFQTVLASFVPVRWHWDLFGAGEALVLLSAYVTYRKTIKNK